MRKEFKGNRVTLIRGLIRSSVALVLISVWSSNLRLLAQVERGTIAGTVRDASGATTPNVTITVTNVATGVDYKTQTNDTGEFVAPNLIPGECSITASLSGFKTLRNWTIGGWFVFAKTPLLYGRKAP